MKKSNIFIISGPTGSGESTITEEIINMFPKFTRLITATTRLPRLNEKNGVDYLFFSKKKFEDELKKGNIAEHTYIANRDTHYGTYKPYLENKLEDGFSIVGNLDSVGARFFKKNYNATNIFIKPDSMDNLRKRLIKREPNISQVELQKRMINAENEIKNEEKYYEYVVINKQDQLDKAIKEVAKIIKNIMVNLIKNIQNFAFQNNLWKKGSKIVLGVSGGPDSVCLLDILNKLAKKYDFKLYIVHVNYNLRGKDSKKDELFIKKLGKKYGIEVSVLLPKKNKIKGNLENNLRKIRYDYFEQVRKKLKFDIVAVAHNQDDQAETVLMRIIRGSGLNGLSSMKAKSGNIIRPILKISRNEILNYLEKNKLEYRIDKSNANTKFTRNSIRHNLIPYLEKNFNPGVKKTLNQWSFSVADDYDFINKNAERFTENICKSRGAEFNAKKFLGLHIAIQRQVLRTIFQQLKKTMVDIENQQIEEIIKIIKSAKSKNQKALIGGLKILKKGDKVSMLLK